MSRQNLIFICKVLISSSKFWFFILLAVYSDKSTYPQPCFKHNLQHSIGSCVESKSLDDILVFILSQVL